MSENEEMPNGAAAILSFGNDQLKALGEMTILFGSLDEAIAKTAQGLLNRFPQLLSLHNGQPLAELRFDDKQDLMKKLVRELAQIYVLDCTHLIDALGAAKNASKDRNRVIHGWLTWDTHGDHPVFRDKKGQDVPADLAEILRIKADVWHALENFVMRFEEFVRAVLQKKHG
jgi:hypothetical protein